MTDDVESTVLRQSTSDFGVFYRGSRDRLYRALALAIGDADIAADAVDEAMTRSVERWDEVVRYENPAGWVYRVGLNWGRSAQRHRSRTPNKSFGCDSYEMSVPEPGLAEAVAALPQRYRTVIVARYYLQWTPAEIAEAIRVPGATVRSRLKRALERLRRHMEMTSRLTNSKLASNATWLPWPGPYRGFPTKNPRLLRTFVGVQIVHRGPELPLLCSLPPPRYCSSAALSGYSSVLLGVPNPPRLTDRAQPMPR